MLPFHGTLRRVGLASLVFSKFNLVISVLCHMLFHLLYQCNNAHGIIVSR